jgi:hypothetical protein
MEMAQAVREAAGWSRQPKSDQDWVEFEVADLPPFKLIQKGQRLAAFQADLGAWPFEENEADQLARRLGRLASGAFNSRRSIISVTSGRLGLHLPFDPSQLELEEVPKICASFLNDLEWWLRNREVNLV